MEKKEIKPGQVPAKPEIISPATKEQREINKEQEQIANEPKKERVLPEPELPQMPEKEPEIKPEKQG